MKHWFHFLFLKPYQKLVHASLPADMAVARLIRPLRKALINPPQTLIPLQNPTSHLLYNNKMGEEINPFLISQTHNSIRRNYMSETRKSAFKDNLLRLVRNEIQYELDRSPPKQVLFYLLLFHFNAYLLSLPVFLYASLFLSLYEIESFFFFLSFWHSLVEKKVWFRVRIWIWKMGLQENY